MICNLGYILINNSKEQPTFTYTTATGTSTYPGSIINSDLKITTKEADGTFEIQFFHSGILKFTKLNSAQNIDIFAVGAGNMGQDAIWNPSQPIAGEGGRSGACVTKKNIHLTTSPIEVKIGSDITNSSFGNYISAQNGQGDNGHYPFDDPSYKTKYGISGTSGDFIQNITAGLDGTDGSPNTGNGGGGGNFTYLQEQNRWLVGKGGKGAIGIIIIRNHR